MEWRGPPPPPSRDAAPPTTHATLLAPSYGRPPWALRGHAAMPPPEGALTRRTAPHGLCPPGLGSADGRRAAGRSLAGPGGGSAQHTHEVDVPRGDVVVHAVASSAARTAVAGPCRVVEHEPAATHQQVQQEAEQLQAGRHQEEDERAGPLVRQQQLGEDAAEGCHHTCCAWVGSMRAGPGPQSPLKAPLPQPSPIPPWPQPSTCPSPGPGPRHAGSCSQNAPAQTTLPWHCGLLKHTPQEHLYSTCCVPGTIQPWGHSRAGGKGSYLLNTQWGAGAVNKSHKNANIYAGWKSRQRLEGSPQKDGGQAEAWGEPPAGWGLGEGRGSPQQDWGAGRGSGGGSPGRGWHEWSLFTCRELTGVGVVSRSRGRAVGSWQAGCGCGV
uniref:Uncharacterized protein n=1 Tax=Mustela putorius furo TaxID=9669 RepID=M3Z8Q6_MUSPF